MGLVHKVPHLIHLERNIPRKIQLIRYSYVDTPDGLRIIDPDKDTDEPDGSYLTLIVQMDTRDFGRFRAISGDTIQTTGGALNPIAALDGYRQESISHLIEDVSIYADIVPMAFTEFQRPRLAEPKIMGLPIHTSKLVLSV